MPVIFQAQMFPSGMFTVAEKGFTSKENVPSAVCPTPSVSVRVKLADWAAPLSIIRFTRPLKCT